MRRKSAARNDEFYTRKEDIERELKEYKPHFAGARVFCNCDDPDQSEFWKFFYAQFKHYGLRKLVATSYTGSSLFSGSPKGWRHTYRGGDATEIKNLDYAYGVFRGGGDFRSPACIRELAYTDIVCTNPPFSLFREYLALLMAHDKKFLIIGNFNAVTYKETFPLIQAGKVWLGVSTGGMEFRKPGGKTQKLGNAVWFTNLTHRKRNEEIPLYETYTPEKYPKYDGYDIINVDKTAEIPADYDREMGVPISFLERYNPRQFEILGVANSARWIGRECLTIIGERRVYNRLIIRKK